MDVRELYDARYFEEQCDGAAAWRRFDGTVETLFPRARRNLELLAGAPGTELLELGCGRGEVAIAAACRGQRVTAVDYSAAAIAMARCKAAEVAGRLGHPLPITFVQSSATELRLPAEFFHQALMSEFIEHLSEAECRCVLGMLHAAIRPGGTLLVYTYPNRLARRIYPLKRAMLRLAGRRLPRRMPDTDHPHYRDYHLNEQSYWSLKRHLSAAGFEADVWFDVDLSGRSSVSRAIFHATRFVNAMNLTAMARRAGPRRR